MRNNNASQWTTAWAVFLLCAVLWATFDHSTASRLIETAFRRFDFFQAAVYALVALGTLSVLALLFRILTFRNE